MSDKLAPSENIYEQLGVLKDTPGHDIHKRFIKLVMKLLREMPGRGQIDGDLQRLRSLWFAHDILIDPSTRTDYDLRALGIQTGQDEGVDDDQSLLNGSAQEPPPPPSWRIGELLQAAELLEPAELDIACDMHKAVPEMRLGGFLFKQGFIGHRQLQAALIGQSLLRSGEINLSQFRSIMKEVEQSKSDIKEILLETGYISQAILTELKPGLG